MILLQPIKFNTNIYTPNQHKNSSQIYKCDTFQRAEAKPSFKGLEREINLHLPIKEAEKMFIKAYRNIVKESDINQKIELSDKCINEFKAIANMHSSLTPEEIGELHHDFIKDRKHEFVNPLHDLMAHNILIKKGRKVSSNEEYNQYFKSISKRIFKTINKFEFFLNKGLNKDDMNLSEVWKLALDSASEKSNQKGINIRVKDENLLEKYKKGLICGGGRRIHDYELYTIFSNILQNAAKYSKEKATILVDFKEKTIKEKKYFVMSFTDRGIGFPKAKEERQKVLNGKRASNAISSGIEGTGYGLQRVNKIVNSLSTSCLKIKSPLYLNDEKFPGSKISCFIKLDEK